MSECINKRIPWMVWEAINKLEQVMRPGMRVFEWGCGGSTLFWLKHSCDVVSIEHNPDWAQTVISKVTQGQLELTTLPPSKDSCPDFSSLQASGCFRHYVTAIDAKGQFDVVCVDGRARNACMRRAMSHVSPTGILILDNSDRQQYAPSILDVKQAGFKSVTFRGTGPEGHGVKWNTTFFSRKADHAALRS